MSFIWTIEGELSEKQKQAFETITKICYTFYDSSKKAFVPRTWGEIEILAGIAKSTLSKYMMKKLVPQGVVKKEKRLDAQGRLKTFYEYTRKPYHFEEKKPYVKITHTTEEALRRDLGSMSVERRRKFLASLTEFHRNGKKIGYLRREKGKRKRIFLIDKGKD